MKTKRRLSQETNEQREERRRREAMRQAERRAAETPEKRRVRRQRDAERKAKQRHNNRLLKAQSEGVELQMTLDPNYCRKKPKSDTEAVLWRRAHHLSRKANVSTTLRCGCVFSHWLPPNQYSSDEIIQCHVCKLLINGKCYVCVQCPDMYMCASCEFRDLHAHHYMLRVPAHQPHEEVMLVLEKIRCDILIGDADLLLENESANPLSLDTCESGEVLEVECDPQQIEHFESCTTSVASKDADSSQNTWDIVENPNMVLEDNEVKDRNETIQEKNIPTVKLKKRKHETKYSENLSQSTDCTDHRVMKDKNPPRKSTRNKKHPKLEPLEKCNEINQDNETEISALELIEDNNKSIKVNQSKPKKAKNVPQQFEEHN